MQLNKFSRYLNQTLSLLSLLVLPMASFADASINISPVNVTITRTHPSQAVSFSNKGEKPHPSEIHNISLWQQDGKDVFTPTKELVALPPSFTIQPGLTQVVRIAYLGKWASKKELAYRIYFHEIHRYENDEGGESMSLLKMDLNISLPVFVEPAGVKLSSHVAGTSTLTNKEVTLNLKNTGNKHSKITHMTVTDAKGQVVADDPTLIYVLAESSNVATKKIQIKNFNPATLYKLKITSEDRQNWDIPIVSKKVSSEPKDH